MQPANQLIARIAAAAAVALSMISCADPMPQPPPTETGVSRALAVYRSSTLSNVRYSLSFNIPQLLTERATGTLILRFHDARPDGPLTLDFTGTPDAVRSVTANGTALPHEVADEHIVIPRGARPATREQEITIEFVAGDQALNRQDEFMYSLFVPDRARTAFPCFDQPDIKARYELSLTIPKGWEAVANGAVTRRDSTEDHTRFRFSETEPVSSYLFAFAAGRFMAEEAQRDGRTFRMLHRETDRARVDRSREAIFDLHAAALRWLEDYTGIPYPFGKFDFVAVPAFQFGGMEHPGAILYRAASLFLEENATTNQLLGRASLISHETAHMWFGNLVTMEWFDDVWMKEVFANFMAAKIVAPSFPEINHELRFLLAHHPAAYGVDRTEGANPIRQELDNLREAGSLYGAIIYQKAPVVMRQLEALVGENTLRDGLRDYLRRHSFANATWPDLIGILDRRSSENLVEWSRVWVTEPGRPRIAAKVVPLDNGTWREIQLEQTDPFSGVRRPLAWNQPVTVAYGNGDTLHEVGIHLRDSRASHRLPTPVRAPDFILPGSDGISYGHFALDESSRYHLLTQLPRVEDPIARSTAWIAIWESLLHGEVQPTDFMRLALRALPLERDELIAQHVLGLLDATFWRFRPAILRTVIAENVEAVLWGEVEREGATARKRAFFDTYVSIAYSGTAIARLRRIWRKEETVSGLVISEEQFITLAKELALRDLSAADDILRTQLGRITNADRRARFAFIMPALSPDQAVCDSVFASFADVANRRREAWVLEAQSALNHPLRTYTPHYVRRSLELAQEIQSTGDIFFPQRWLSATLSGHQSAQAAEVVRGFLAEMGPAYPARLRAKILQAADPLFRAARITDAERE
jgi:aminopeptidase N